MVYDEPRPIKDCLVLSVYVHCPGTDKEQLVEVATTHEFLAP